MSQGYVGGPVSNVSASAPSSVRTFVDSIHEQLERQEKLYEELRQRLSPVIFDGPAVGPADRNAKETTVPCASPVVCSLRAILGRIETQNNKLAYLRDVVEL